MNDRNRNIIVKLFDLEDNLLGRGKLLYRDNTEIKMMGKLLPELNSGTNVIVRTYDELVGVTTYKCTVRVASYKEINFDIDEIGETVERRAALKVKTDLTFKVNKLFRKEEDILDRKSRPYIYIHNLSQGGMLVSTKFEIQIGDVINFYFIDNKSKPTLLEAEVIRVDKEVDEDNTDIEYTFYGCKFINITGEQQGVIIRYLFERQIQLYRGEKE